MPSTRTEALALQAPLTKQLEGCRLVGYPDTAGVPTVGYGHTGPEVIVGVTITQEIADHDFVVDQATLAAKVDAVCGVGKIDTLLENHERAALYDFAFNLGVDPAWTIWADVRKGNLADVPAQIRRFVYEHKAGKVEEVPGLEHRREAEIIFWNTADVAAAMAVATTSAAVPAPPSGYTRAVVTPPAPVPAPPAAKASLVAKAVTTAGGAALALGSQAQQVHNIVSPYVDNAKVFQTLDTIAVGGIIAAGVIGLLIHEYQTQARKT